MADIFRTCDAVNLLRGKIVHFYGDSNIRGLYKDILCLLSRNRLITESELSAKVERSFLGDRLIRGSPLTKGRSFKEDRILQIDGFHIEFHFVTKCYNEDIERNMNEIKSGKQPTPDVVLMNSTLWDVNRWGVRGVELFKENMVKLMQLFQSCLPQSTLVVWTTAPPLATNSSGGFFIEQIEFAKYTIRFEVMEANMYTRDLLVSNGYDVLDFHYHLRMHTHRRRRDGIHWTSKSMRHLSNLVLTHIARAWSVPLPGNIDLVPQPQPEVQQVQVPPTRNTLVARRRRGNDRRPQQPLLPTPSFSTAPWQDTGYGTLYHSFEEPTPLQPWKGGQDLHNEVYNNNFNDRGRGPVLHDEMYNDCHSQMYGGGRRHHY